MAPLNANQKELAAALDDVVEQLEADTESLANLRRIASSSVEKVLTYRAQNAGGLLTPDGQYMQNLVLANNHLTQLLEKARPVIQFLNDRGYSWQDLFMVPDYTHEIHE